MVGNKLMKSEHGRKASLVGSLVTAFLASICCIGPVIFAILGISGAAFVQRFEDYRPLFVVLAVGFLGVSFYFTYRKKSAEQCEPDSYCANPRSDRINKIVLWIATVFVALIILFPRIAEVFAGERETRVGETVERDYLIKGMTCGGCVLGVKKALNRAGLTKEQIFEVDYKKPDPEHKVGHAKVRLFRDQYKGEETDCKIIREIRESPGYIAYLDTKNTDPCKLGQK